MDKPVFGNSEKKGIIILTVQKRDLILLISLIQVTRGTIKEGTVIAIWRFFKLVQLVYVHLCLHLYRLYFTT